MTPIKPPRNLAVPFCCFVAACTAGLSLVVPNAIAAEEPVSLGYVWDARFKEHDTGEGHPESPERLEAIRRAVAASNLPGRILPIEPRVCEDSWIQEAHTFTYLMTATRAITGGKTQLTTGDTAVSPGSLQAAKLAAGGVLEACDAVMSGRVKRAFCAVRPPGHHATKTRGMGFCIFNNVAIATRYLRLHHAVERILIVDWDVHHGNGTYAILADDPHVFQFHLHQEDIYPGTGNAEDDGKGEGKGNTITHPLPEGTDGGEFVALFNRKLLPAMKTFKPTFILISAGFDSHRDDPVGGLSLTADDYGELTRILCDLADQYGEGRIVSVLEGGYNLQALAESVITHMEALADGQAAPAAFR